MVRGVLVCVCACAWVAAAAEVPQEVDRIFKTVDSLMDRGGDSELQRSDKSHPSPVASDRAFPGSAAFPVGVVLSDKLYPLVVGRNLETGVPFVMNLDKQHALVVARGGADDYRMLIPFPVVVGSPHAPRPQHDPSESQYGSGRSPSYPVKTPYYPSYVREPPKKYLADPHTRGEYYDGPTHSEHGSSSNSQDAYGPSKVPGKYASDYQSYRNYYSSDAGKIEDPRYKPSPPKKYLQKTNYINYFGVEHKPAPVVSGKYVPFSIDRPVSKYRVRNYTRYLSSDGELSYHVAGPKYTVVPQFAHSYATQPQSYRATGPPLRYAGPAKQYPPPRQAHGGPGSADGEPASDFKPSPYLGSIPDDGHSAAAPLEDQSEEFESYDDREPDYIETSSRSRPSSSVGVKSSGGVHHVTHHADDYLGKIYEDMYYKVAPNTYSDGPPSYEALESRQKNSTDAAPARTGPVTFDPPRRGGATE